MTKSETAALAEMTKRMRTDLERAYNTAAMTGEYKEEIRECLRRALDELYRIIQMTE